MADAIEDTLAKRFRIDRPPTLLARRSTRGRIGFSRVRSSHPMRGRSLAVPPEEAFSFHVPLSVPFFSDLWTAGRRREVPDIRLGDAQLIDLGDNPVVSLDTSFDSLRFYIIQVALDEMANEAGIGWVSGLYAPNFGGRDLVMFGLAQALAGAMQQPATPPPCFRTVLRSPSLLTSYAPTAARRARTESLAVASHRGNSGAPANLSTPI